MEHTKVAGFGGEVKFPSIGRFFGIRSIACNRIMQWFYDNSERTAGKYSGVIGSLRNTVMVFMLKNSVIKVPSNRLTERFSALQDSFTAVTGRASGANASHCHPFSRYRSSFKVREALTSRIIAYSAKLWLFRLGRGHEALYCTQRVCYSRIISTMEKMHILYVNKWASTVVCSGHVDAGAELPINCANQSFLSLIGGRCRARRGAGDLLAVHLTPSRRYLRMWNMSLIGLFLSLVMRCRNEQTMQQKPHKPFVSVIRGSTAEDSST